LHHTNLDTVGSIGRLDTVYCLLSLKYQAFHDPLLVRRKFNIGDPAPASRRIARLVGFVLGASLEACRAYRGGFHGRHQALSWIAVSVKQEVLEISINP
jgi:hypothetical protein